MRIKILSDLHIDYNYRYLGNRPELAEGDYDLVILAGDTAEGTLGLDWAETVFPRTDKIFIPGNHEYYHEDIDDLDAAFDCEPIVYNNTTYYKDNVRFICTTLWTDFALYQNPETSRLIATRSIADFNVIKDFDTIKCIERNKKSVEYIEQELSRPFIGITILVTHFGVSWESIHPMYAGSSLNPYFYTDLEYIFAKYSVDYCIHGHTHSSIDYTLHGTRVICNPYGYYTPWSGPENPNFNPNLIIEV